MPPSSVFQSLANSDALALAAGPPSTVAKRERALLTRASDLARMRRPLGINGSAEPSPLEQGSCPTERALFANIHEQCRDNALRATLAEIRIPTMDAGYSVSTTSIAFTSA